MSNSKLRVLIDCDPGHDDVFAIGVAARHCEIVGITSVAGNSPIENTTRNACIARELFGFADVPVHQGADGPLDGSRGRFAFDAHGRTGLDGPAPRTPARGVDGTDAVSFLVETVRANEGIWVAAIGPLTNIALALRAAPDLARRVAGISIMGGSLSFGNVTAAAEFNVWFDPEAADEVFRSGAPIRMCGLDLTHQITGDGVFRDALLAAESDAGRFCGELMAYYHTFSARLGGVHGREADLMGAPLHDPCAILAIAFPDEFEMTPRHVRVECLGTHTRGMTLADERPWMTSIDANVDVVTTARAPVKSVATILNSLLAF